MKPVESGSGWKNWGDHPVVVLIGAIAALVTIVVLLTDMFDMAVPSASTETPTISPPAREPSTAISNITFDVDSVMISEKDGMSTLYVPAGEFTMGSNRGKSDERPVHTVYLNTFWIDQTEATNDMYRLCVKDNACRPPHDDSSTSRSFYYGNPRHDVYPVIYVDWYQAKAYCAWANRRLPTEAEWEKAARGTDQRIYPWGDSIDCSLANYWGKENGCKGDTTEVGKYLDGASPYGALDMAGNVWEWVADWYSGAARGPSTIVVSVLPTALGGLQQVSTTCSAFVVR